MGNPLDLINEIKDNPDPDAKVLWQLIQAGSNLTKPHEPDFAFSAEMEENAQLIGKALADMGFRVSIYAPEEENNGYEVVGVAFMILELKVLNQLSEKFLKIARIYNGEYLGWGTEIVE